MAGEARRPPEGEAAREEPALLPSSRSCNDDCGAKRLWTRKGAAEGGRGMCPIPNSCSGAMGCPCTDAVAAAVATACASAHTASMSRSRRRSSSKRASRRYRATISPADRACSEAEESSEEKGRPCSREDRPAVPEGGCFRDQSNPSMLNCSVAFVASSLSLLAANSLSRMRAARPAPPPPPPLDDDDADFLRISCCCSNRACSAAARAARLPTCLRVDAEGPPSTPRSPSNSATRLGSSASSKCARPLR